MNRQIKPLLLLLALMLCQDGFATPAWIEQASRPGPNTASVGQSRFDELFLHEAGKYRIPYPFERLIEVLESRLDNGDQPAVRKVFDGLNRKVKLGTIPRTASFSILTTQDYEKTHGYFDYVFPKHYFWHRGFDGMYGSIARASSS